MAKTRSRATMGKPLNARQRLFVSEYLKDLNAAQAYARAYGAGPAVAETNGPRLLRNAQVQAAVKAGTAEKLARNALTADRVLEEYRRVAFADIRTFFDANGNLIPVQDLDEERAACLASLEVLIKNAKDGDGHTAEVHKIKVWDKTRALV
jgi:phage terminase small subunit